MQWDIVSGQLRASSTNIDTGGVYAKTTVLAQTADSRFLLLAPRARTRAGWVTKWNLASLTMEWQLHAHISQDIGQLAVSPDGQILATTGSDTYVRLWSTNTRDPLKDGAMRGNLLSIHAVAFSPDGIRLATGSNGKEAVKLWDLGTRQEVLTLEGKGMLFTYVRFSPDGNLLVAINGDRQAHLWRAPTWEEIEAAEKVGKEEP